MSNEAICKLVGHRLRWRRRCLDLTQAQVARRCGITSQQIHKYEAGLVDLPIARLVALANALSMPMSEIVEDLSSCVGANDHAEPSRFAQSETALSA